MSKISLKSIFSKKNEIANVVCSLIEQMNAQVIIQDANEVLLLGELINNPLFEHSLTLNEDIIGFVRGDEKSIYIAKLLQLLIQKEAERKNLGSEVLLLYQEVNMVFNFSDKLAHAIEPAAIAQVAVEEAMRLIKSASGIVLLWNEKNNHLQIAAASGQISFNKNKIEKNIPLLFNIGMKGQSDIMHDLTALHEAEIVTDEIQSIVYAPLKVNKRIMGAIILAGEKPLQYAASDLKFLTTLALQSSSAIESALLYEKNLQEAREKEEAMRRIYEITAKFVPFEFIGSLGHKVITDVKLGDQVEKVVTVLFTDIRDYTTLSEQMTPEENFHFVSSYNMRMGPIIRDHNGFINQYLGDAIMALFPESAEAAVLAAIEMQKNVNEFNEMQRTKNGHYIKMGIGMHTGPLIMGITGDTHRMDATTISDAVNTASRIESLTKYYKANILISDATLQQIKNPEDFHLRYLGKVQVKGKLSSIGIHECFSSDVKDQVERKKKNLSVFHEGMNSYLSKSFQNAVKAFEFVINENPLDKTAQFFLDNATKNLQKGVSENWSGVVEMSSK